MLDPQSLLHIPIDRKQTGQLKQALIRLKRLDYSNADKYAKKNFEETFVLRLQEIQKEVEEKQASEQFLDMSVYLKEILDMIDSHCNFIAELNELQKDFKHSNRTKKPAKQQISNTLNKSGF